MIDDILMLWVWLGIICTVGLIAGLGVYLYYLYEDEPEFMICWAGSLFVGLMIVLIIF